MVCRWVERDLCRAFQPQAPLLTPFLGCSPKLLPSAEQGGDAVPVLPRPREGEAGWPLFSPAFPGVLSKVQNLSL